jgi:hypothetical protein
VPIIISDDSFSVMYTVIGIIFPLALSQIMAFSFTEIQNNQYIERQRTQLGKIRNLYIFLFVIATLLLLLKSTSINFQWKLIRFDIKDLIIVYFVFCLFYFVINFISLANLKNQIDDKIRETKQDNETN